MRSGRTQAETKALVKLSFCRVAEYQRRGVVHLHAVIRADGINGTKPPLNVEQLARASLSAARAVSVTHASGIVRWGNQVDVQVLDRSDGRRAQKVAQYVAKYATKSSAESGALDCRITSEEDLSGRALSPHVRTMAEVAWRTCALMTSDTPLWRSGSPPAPTLRKLRPGPDIRR